MGVCVHCRLRLHFSRHQRLLDASSDDDHQRPPHPNAHATTEAQDKDRVNDETRPSQAVCALARLIAGCAGQAKASHVQGTRVTCQRMCVCVYVCVCVCLRTGTVGEEANACVMSYMCNAMCVSVCVSACVCVCQQVQWAITLAHVRCCHGTVMRKEGRTSKIH